MTRPPRRHRASAAGWLVAAAIATLTWPAGSQDLRGFALVYATRSIDFYARASEGVRAADARAAEEYLMDARRRLGATGNAQRFSYYRVGHPVDVEAIAGRYTTGATSYAGDRVVAVQACNRHELVHVASGALGHPGRFFDEGLAVALAQTKGWRGSDADRAAKRALTRVPLRRFVDGFESLPEIDAYAVAGSFVGYLIRHHGLPALADFFRDVHTWSTRGWVQQREAAFRRIFGASIEEEGAKWRSSL